MSLMLAMISRQRRRGEVRQHRRDGADLSAGLDIDDVDLVSGGVGP